MKFGQGLGQGQTSPLPGLSHMNKTARKFPLGPRGQRGNFGEITPVYVDNFDGIVNPDHVPVRRRHLHDDGRDEISGVRQSRRQADQR